MGTSLALGAAADVGDALALEAEAATGLVADWAAADALCDDTLAGDELGDGELGDDAAALGADEGPAPQADSASPTPRSSTETPAMLVIREKCPRAIIISPYCSQ
jgi:hypothetical protein